MVAGGSGGGGGCGGGEAVEMRDNMGIVDKFTHGDGRPMIVAVDMRYNRDIVDKDIV